MWVTSRYTLLCAMVMAPAAAGQVTGRPTPGRRSATRATAAPPVPPHRVAGTPSGSTRSSAPDDDGAGRAVVDAAAVAVPDDRRDEQAEQHGADEHLHRVHDGPAEGADA